MKGKGFENKFFILGLVFCLMILMSAMPIPIFASANSNITSDGLNITSQINAKSLKEGIRVLSSDLVNLARYNVSIAVKNASRIGRYTEATAEGKRLLFGYPVLCTSYTTIRIDGNNYCQDVTMDSYATQMPTIIGDSIVTKWSLPQNVDISQDLTLMPDTTKYRLAVTNNDHASHNIKIRYMFDTMLADNDGAPFRVPGVGDITTEQEFINPVFDYWQAMDRLANPTLTSNCTFVPGKKPYKVQFAKWGDIHDEPFDYRIREGRNITSETPVGIIPDTAVGMYWDLGTLVPDETKDVVVYYGTALFNITKVEIIELFTEFDNYRPSQTVSIFADIGNGGDAPLIDGQLAINITNPEDEIVFESVSDVTINPDQTISRSFTYNLPRNALGGVYTINATIRDAETNLLHQKGATFSVLADAVNITITPKISDANIGSSHNLNVKFINTQDSADNIFVALTTNGIPEPHKADLSWFNWNSKIFSMKAGEEVDIPLLCSIPDNETICSNKSFMVIATTSYTGQSVYDDTASINIIKPPQKCCREWEDECPEIVYSEPVEIITGNLILSHQDLYIPNGRGPAISIERTYNSRSSENGLFGYGWNFNYDYRFTTNSNGDVVLRQCEGKVFIFENTTSGYEAPPGLHEDLTKLLDGSYIKTLKDGTKQYFDVNGKLTKIEDRNGNALDFTYNSGKLVKIEDNSGHTVTLTYENNRIKKISAPENRVIEYTYSANKLVSVSDAMDNVVKYEYDNYNNLIARTTPNSGRYEYSYTADDKLYSQKDPEGNEKLFNYDNVQRKVTITDENGNDEARQYDRDYDVILITNALGQTETYEWNLNHYLLNKIDVYGYKTQYIRDAKDNIVKVINPCGYDVTYEYWDKYNLVTKETKMVGGTEVSSTTYSYDANGNLVGIRDAEGGVTSYIYNIYGQQTSMIDANGHTTSYTYSPDNGYLKKEIDAQGNDMSYTYDEMGNRISETTTSADGTQSVTILYEYDKNNQLIRITDALNRDTTYSYDANGNKIKETDSRENVIEYEYYKNDLLKAIKEPLGKTTTYTYYGGGLTKDITVENDPNNQITAYGYDALGRVTKITDAEGNVTRYSYGLTVNLVNVTNPRGYSTITYYDAIGRIINVTDATGNPTRYNYDDLTLTDSITDANGKVTYNKCDKVGRLVKVIRKVGDTADIIDANDAVTEYEYDKVGNPVAEIDPNGNRVEYEYNERNELVKESNPEGESTLYAYDFVGNRIKETPPSGNVINYTYDSVNQLVNIYDSIGKVASYTYDAGGNRLTETDGNGKTMRYEYDALNRLVEVIDPMGRETEYQYDRVDNLIRIIDREGKVTTYEYDRLNRCTKMTDAMGYKTTYKYDSVSNLVKITDANGNPTIYEYDGVNRLTKEIYADGGVRTFNYNGVGNLVQRVDQKGQVTSYLYDDLHRQTNRTYSDPSTADDIFTYDKGGRMLTAKRDGWLIQFSYDKANRLNYTIQDDTMISYTYDVPNNTRTIYYPGGKVITETMDERNRLYSVNDGGAVPIADFDYDLGDRILTRTYRNGVVTEYDYNKNNWVTQLVHKNGADIIAGFEYDFDKEGNKKFEKKQHDLTHSEAYEYNDIYQLINYKVGELVGSTVPMPSIQTTYNLDSVGNWLNKTTDGAVENRTHNEVNEITAIDNQLNYHDEKGNLIDDCIYTYGYDVENRLISITRKSDGRIVGEYNYDALSRRIKKNVSGAITFYTYDGGRVI